MKCFKNIFAIAVLAAVFSACNGDQKEPESLGNYPSDGVVRISTSLVAPQSRANESAYTGKTLGLFLDYGAGNKFSMDNVCWNNDNGTWTAVELMRWQDAKTKVGIYAYAPFDSAVTDASKVSFEIPGDQTNGVDTADFVYDCQPEFTPSVGLDGTEAVPLTFKHALVKLTVNLSMRDQFEGSNVTIKGVTLKRSAGKVICDLKNAGATTIATDSHELDINMHSLSENSYEAIFYPYNGQQVGARMLEVTLDDDRVFFYEVPTGGISFQGGSSYTMTLYVGKDMIKMADDIDVNEWSENDITGGEAEN